MSKGQRWVLFVLFMLICHTWQFLIQSKHSANFSVKKEVLQDMVILLRSLLSTHQVPGPGLGAVGSELTDCPALRSSSALGEMDPAACITAMWKVQ